MVLKVNLISFDDCIGYLVKYISMICIDILNILRSVNGRSQLLFSFLTSVENHHVKSNIWHFIDSWSAWQFLFIPDIYGIRLNGILTSFRHG